MRVRIPPRALLHETRPRQRTWRRRFERWLQVFNSPRGYHAGKLTGGPSGLISPNAKGSSPSAGTTRARSNGKTPARHAGDSGFNSRGAHHAGLGYWLFLGPTRRRCRFDSCTPYNGRDVNVGFSHPFAKRTGDSSRGSTPLSSSGLDLGKLVQLETTAHCK